MPSKHANCCGDCSTQIEELGEACPTCRSVIHNSFIIFINSIYQQNFLFSIVNHIIFIYSYYCCSKLQK